MKYLKAIKIAAAVSFISLPAWTAFTTSEFGSGSYTDGSAVGDILNNFLGTGGAEQISLADLSALASAFGSANSFDYSSNASLSLFDMNNDGSLSKLEFVSILNGMSAISGVTISGNGQYAEAYAAELGAISSPVTANKIQAAITAGNAYAVGAPLIQHTVFSYTSLNSNHTSNLGLLDGLGAVAGNGNLTTTFTASHDDDPSATSRFTIAANGMLGLASGTNIQDLSAGLYTVVVTTTDNNSETYGLSTTENVSLTVSNESGCVVNENIASASFDTNGDSSLIDGATVTIDGSHNTNDLLFVRTASKSTSGSIVSYTNFGQSGVSAAYNKGTGQLTFTGSASLADWITIFRKVGYIYDSSGVASPTTRSLIFALSGNVVFNHSDGNSHFYKYITDASIDFDAALTAADGSTLYGLQGYLATITSADEQNYIEPKLNGVGWIGGCDRIGDSTVQTRCGITAADLNNLKGVSQSSWTNTGGYHSYGDGESYFYWVTGPERLEFIGEDTRNCNSSNYAARKQETLPISSDSSLTDPQVSIDTTSSNLGYHNFQGCEPNNYRHTAEGENYLHVYGSGGWNDYRHNDSGISGYLVEYGGMSGDPSVDLTENKSYDAATEGQFCAY